MPALLYSDFRGYVPSSCELNPVDVQLLVDSANTIAERYCNRAFSSPAEATEYYDLPPPGGRDEIVLARHPVTAVAEVRIDGRGGFGQLTNTFGTNTILTAGYDYYYEPGTDILRVLHRRVSWPVAFYGGGGSYGYPLGINTRNATKGTVQVTYTAGYTVMPADLVAAVAQLAQWMLTTAMESGGRAVSSANYIDVAVTYGASAAVDALAYGNVPALGSARQILNSYREAAVAAGPRW